MDFIEKIFNLSPDHGSGAFELMLFMIPIVGYTLMTIVRHQLAIKRNCEKSISG